MFGSLYRANFGHGEVVWSDKTDDVPTPFIARC